MQSKIKILITSVGSLVGQNILDVLEYPNFNRRDKVQLIGINSIASSPNNYRCDRCYLVPNTSKKEFKSKFHSIIKDEDPDLILSGRDEDTDVVTTTIRGSNNIKAKTPYGSIHSLQNALNKLKSWNFCQKYRLPFAKSFVINQSGDSNQLKLFVQKNEFPLIAKPIQGFASKGVIFIRNWDDLNKIRDRSEYILQEYLGDAETLSDYFDELDKFTPLFAHAPNIYHHSCHTVINPDGTFAPIFISRNEHNSGATVGFKKINNPELEKLTTEFIHAIYKEGGFGPVTIQFRRNKKGEWKAQEMNMRTNGNTFPRFIMGQDDLGLIVKYTLPDTNFPVYSPPEENQDFIISKSFMSNIMTPEKIDYLINNQIVTR